MVLPQRKLHRSGEQQLLRGKGAIAFQALQSLLEQDPLMGGSLVHTQKS
jgi:hypothetical protein